MPKTVKKTEPPEKHTILVVEMYWVSAEVHTYSIYVDNNLEVEGIDEDDDTVPVASDKELIFLYGLENEPVDVKRIVVEDPNKLFQSDLLYTLPEDAPDFWNILTNNAIKVENGVWRLQEDLT